MNRSDADLALESAIAAAESAGEILLRGLPSSEKGVRTKGHPNNPVTLYDRRAEEEIVRILEGRYPDDGILSEESEPSAGRSGRLWIVDPLDGTSNFLAGIGHFSISIALVDGDEALAGCVHDPVRRETFTAIRGDGTRLNGEPIHVSIQDSLDGARLAFGLSYLPERRAKMIRFIEPFLARAGFVRLLGSAALDLAYIAAGRLDAACHPMLNAWDVAAGRLLIEEAGGRLSDLQGAPLGDPSSGLAASNGRLHQEFVDALG